MSHAGFSLLRKKKTVSVPQIFPHAGYNRSLNIPTNHAVMVNERTIHATKSKMTWKIHDFHSVHFSYMRKILYISIVFLRSLVNPDKFIVVWPPILTCEIDLDMQTRFQNAALFLDDCALDIQNLEHFVCYLIFVTQHHCFDRSAKLSKPVVWNNYEK